MSILKDVINKLNTTKVSLKNAITQKGVTVSDNDKLETYADKIALIETGIDTSDANANASDLAENKTAYVDGTKIVGSLADDVSQPAPTITIQGGVVHASYTPTAGIVRNTTVRNADSVNLNIVEPDLLAGNIKVGVNLFGIDGNFTSDANAAASDILSGKTAYVNGTKVNGSIQTVTQPSPSITINNETGSITASYTPAIGYNNDSSIKSITQSLSSSVQAENIKANTKVLGVDGTFTADADAIASDIMLGKTAYVNGNKIIGEYNPPNFSEVTAEATDVVPGKKFIAADGILTDGALPIPNQPKPSISLDNETGTVTANYSPVAGLVVDTTALSETLELSNLINSSNIKAGITLFSVTGTYTNDANATAADIASGKTAYVNGSKIEGSYNPPDLSGVTVVAGDVVSGKKFVSSSGVLTSGTLVTTTQPLPSISVNSTTGVVTASYTPNAGVVSDVAVKSKTLNLSSYIQSSNIKSGVTIFGITGSYVGSGGGNTLLLMHFNSNLNIEGVFSKSAVVPEQLNSMDSEFGGTSGENWTPTYTSGKFSNCIKFTGTGSNEYEYYNHRLILPVAANILLNNAFTIEFWYKKLTGWDNDGGVIGATSINTIMLDVRGSGSTHYVDSGIGNGVGWTERDPSYTQFSNNTWHHVAMVKNGSTIIIYVDGNKHETRSTVSSLSRMSFLTLGSLSCRLDCLVDELRISSIARYTGDSFTVPTSAFVVD